jgi:predicted  nucleic acid-binding Zn-ribbon protein
MGDTKDIKATWQQELERLAGLRDELKVQLNLAKSELEQEWTKLEGGWDRVQDELKRVGEHTKEPAQKLGSAAGELLDELKQGYERILSQLKPKR